MLLDFKWEWDALGLFDRSGIAIYTTDSACNKIVQILNLKYGATSYEISSVGACP